MKNVIREKIIIKAKATKHFATMPNEFYLATIANEIKSTSK